VAWDDADIGIAWPLDLIGGAANVLLSDKDRTKASAFKHAEVFA